MTNAVWLWLFVVPVFVFMVLVQTPAMRKENYSLALAPVFVPCSSSRDSASDGIVIVMQLSNMAARMLKTANYFETSSNSFCKDCITGVIHP